MSGPDRGVFKDRRRAESFGSEAQRYDAGRPSYPTALIDWLSRSGQGLAADVGCGTGQVARLLTDAGWRVVGVEIDERMAEVARSHGIVVQVSDFERWQPNEHFELITSGQAWHWIDPEVGYRRAAELLRPSGRLAVFWNSYRYERPVQDAIETVVGRHAPNLLADSVPFGTASPDHVALDGELVRRSSQWFHAPEVRSFPHGRTLDIDGWLTDMMTHSPIAMLSEDARARLLDELGSTLTELTGGSLRIDYETRVTAARRR